MKETFEKILKVEAECDEIKHRARSDAKRTKDIATATGKELVKERRRDANKRAYEIMDKANQNADALIARAKQEINTEYINLTASAEKNMKNAVEYIVEKVINSL